MPLKLMTVDPLVSTNFFITVTGESILNITSIDGLHEEIEVADVNQRSASGHLIQHKIMSRSKMAGTFTIKRIQPNTIKTDPVWKWFAAIRKTGMKATGRTSARKGGSIIGYDSALEAKSKWTFKDAWPSKIEVDGFDVEKNDPIHETITIQYETLQRTQ